MKIIKKIILFPYELIKTILNGASYVCVFLAKGFFAYFVWFFKLLGKILPFKFINKLEEHYKKRQNQPEVFLLIVLYFIIFVTIYNVLYVTNDSEISTDKFIKEDIVEKDNTNDSATKEEFDLKGYSKEDLSLFKKYGKYSLKDINISSLKNTNSDTVCWLTVDGTNINYPIVQTSDNDYYLNHTYDKSFRMTGWTFMDYRNEIDLSDDNTIFYGHNLLNNTSFGSVQKIFSKNWKNNSNHTIMVITENKRYYYKVFSAYYSDPNTYYLTTNFASDEERVSFYKSIKKKSILGLDYDLKATDKIITLSTCTDDNKGRKVVHAVLMSIEG